MIGICQHPGCKETIVIQCFFPYEELSDDEDQFYCVNHCNEHGYCQGCGVFWRGIETFDFAEEFCENCRAQTEEPEEIDDDNSEPISDEVDESGYRRFRL